MTKMIRITWGGEHSNGFTVVETIIVLAVTGILFVSAVSLIEGRQNEAEFMTGINNLQQQIQQIINETASGYYPNNGTTFSCSSSPGSAPTITPLPSGSTQYQGTNGDCIFLGKAVYFNGSSSAGNFTVYPLTGNRLDVAGNQVTSLSAARPVAIAPGASSPSGYPNDSTTFSAENGLMFAWAKYETSPGTYALSTSAVVAFINSPTSFGNPSLLSGSQQLGVYGFDVPAPQNVVDAINNNMSSTSPLYGLELCFNSGGTNQSGVITIGGHGGSAVSLAIKDVPC